MRGSGELQLAQRAPRLVNGLTGQPGAALRLSVAPNVRAALLWGLDCAEFDEYSEWAAEAAPGRPFRRAHRVARDGEPADIAIRSSGTVLALREAGGERHARVHRPGKRFGAPKTITRDAGGPVASFDGTRPRVEWRGGASRRDG